MSKIFSTQFNKGSLIDNVSTTALTITGSPVLKDTEKGMAFSTSGTTQKATLATSFGALTKATIVWWGKNYKLQNSAGLNIASAGNVPLLWMNSASDGNWYFSVGDTVGRYGYCALTNYHNMMQVVMVYDGTQAGNAKIKAYVNGVQQTLTYVGTIPTQTLTSGTLNIGYDVAATNYSQQDVLKGEVHNTAWTQTDVNNDYSKFLKATNIKKPKSILKMKPNALKESGLTAAWNMTRQGGKFNDISGNGNNLPLMVNSTTGTDGVRFPLSTSYVGSNTPLAITDTSDYTIMATVNLIPGTSQYDILDNVNGTNRTGFCINNNLIGINSYYSAARVGRVGILPIGTGSKATLIAGRVGGVYFAYVNGVADTLSSTAGLVEPSGIVPLCIGGRSGFGDNFSGEIQDIRVYNRGITAAEARKYHNSQIKTTLLEDFSNNGADGVVKPPEGWRAGTTTASIQEQTTTENQFIKKGIKVLNFTGSGTMILPAPSTVNAYNQISYWYWNGSTWANRVGLLGAPVTGVALSGGLLTFTSAQANDKIALIKIKDGITL